MHDAYVSVATVVGREEINARTQCVCGRRVVETDSR
jgi:hypothetical protein